MKRKTSKKNVTDIRGLVFILILAAFLLVGLLAAQNIVQTRGKAATSNCLSENRTCFSSTQCCPGLKCISNKCLQGTTPPTSGPATITLSTPTPACVMNRIGCGPINCGGMTCSAGSACYQNSCYPTNTVCTVETACSAPTPPYGGTPTPPYGGTPTPPYGGTPTPPPYGPPTPTPGCTYCTHSGIDIGCGPRACGASYCQRYYMCTQDTQNCCGKIKISYVCTYNRSKCYK